MSCENFTTNGRPVGIGYDANGNAKSLAELTTLIVSSVSATSIVGLNIDSIDGFTITEPEPGQFLTYNQEDGTWVNVTVTPGEGISNGFSQITVDGQTTIAATGEAILNIAEGSNAVDITTAGNTLTIDVNQGNIQIAQNQVTDLVTDLGQKLEDITNESLGDLVDVVINNETLAENNVLVWNGSNWENQSSPGGGITVALNDLTDVNAPSPAGGYILVFKEATNSWESLPQDEVFDIINAIYANKGETGATHELVTAGDLLNFKTSNSDNAVELTVSRNTAGGLDNDIELEINVDGELLDISTNSTIGTIEGDISTLQGEVSDIQTDVGSVSSQLANKQPLDSTLTTIASLDPPANSLIYFTGINLAATTTLSTYGRSLIGSTLAKNDIPIATGGGGVDAVSYENFFKNAFNLTDNVPLNAESSGGPIITDVNKRGSPLHVSEYASGMDVSNTDVWWDTYAPLFFNHNKLQYLASGNPHPQYASSSLSATVSSLQTSTINLSSYISANEGLWSSGAGGVTDHGALSGLGDNDHPQYATLSGAIFTGSILAPSVSATGVSATTFNGKSLAGVTYNSIQDGDILVWDNTSSVWYNSSSLSDLQTSTINLSAYIAANEALWSSGASEPSSVVSIQFETGIVTELDIGEIAWNDDYSTIDIQTSTDTTLQVGQEQVIKVRNETGDTLYNGDVVYVSGVHGTGAAKLQVAKASANTDCTIQNIVGICTQDISHNSDGFITTFGYVRNVNTSAFSVGDVVYLANTAGEYTNTQEAKPSHSIRLGTVARSHATDGIIFVKIDPGYDTTFLHDVENDPPESSGQVLIWNSTSSLYQHGGHNSLADLTVGNPHTQYATLSGATFTGQIQAPIVSATTVSAGTLHVGGSDGYIKNNNGNIFISAINGTVVIPSLSSSQFTTVSSNLDSHIASASVHYPSSVITSWVESNFASSVHNHALSSLSDTQIASVVDGQTIIWSGAANRWVNTTPSEGVTDHALLTGLLSDTAHPQYVLSSTNSSLSSLVSNIEASTIGLSSYIAANESSWSSGGVTDHGALTGLGDNDHPQYATLSGATFTGNILAPSVSATNISATQINGGDLAVADYTGIAQGDVLIWNNSTSAWNNSKPYLSSLLLDVQITGTPSTSSVLKWNGAKWVPAPDATGTGGAGLTDAYAAIYIEGDSLEATGADTIFITGDNYISPSINAGEINFAFNVNSLSSIAPYYTPSSWVNSNYVTTSTNSSLSTTVSNHIGSASVHYPSSVITDYITTQNFANATDLSNHIGSASVHFTSGTVTDWVILQGYASATQLANYVLTSTNSALSTTVSNHIGSASVHYPSSVITNYIDDQAFATQAELTGYATTGSLNSHVTSASVHYPSSVVTDWVSLQGYASATQLNNYVLTSTNNSLSTTVSNHIGSASVHYPSSVITNYIDDQAFATQAELAGYATTGSLNSHVTSASVHYASSVVTDWVTSQNYATTSQLSDYVLTSTNTALSTTVSNIQTSTINLSSYIAANESSWSSGGISDHGDLTGLGDNDHPQYATLSGATFTGNVLAPSVSATNLSATQINGGDLAVADYINIQNNDILKWQSSTSSWVNASGNLSTSDTLAAGDIFYYNGTSVKKLAKPSAVAVLTINPATSTLSWIEAEAGGGNLTLVYNDEDSTIVFSAV